MSVKTTKPKLSLRRSAKYEPLIAQIEKLAEQNSGAEFTATLMSILELGLKAHATGLRVSDGILINIKNGVTEMNVDREVARSVFTSLAGSLINISQGEENKQTPDQSRIEFCELASSALFVEHGRFRHYTDTDVTYVFENIAPILKQLRLTSSSLEKEQILENNKTVLQSLIDKTGVTL